MLYADTVNLGYQCLSAKEGSNKEYNYLAKQEQIRIVTAWHKINISCKRTIKKKLKQIND